ncbi:MAG: hydroxymethylbilane synthase [Chloroflexota bacterium]
MTTFTKALVAGSRGSSLALAQTNWVLAKLRGAHPDRDFIAEVRTIATEGDRSQSSGVPLAQIAGRGVFVKDLEHALAEGAIDFAVHSLKDMTSSSTDAALTIAAFPGREDPRDVVVSRNSLPIASQPAGARIGTSSPRRAAQLSLERPDLAFVPIRGNVDTRIRKVESGEYDAVVLAAAGLLRLGLAAKITEYLSPDRCLPDPGQGALAVEVRAGDHDILEFFAAIDDPVTRATVTAERAFLSALGGGCQTPAGALATIDGATLTLRALIVSGGRRIEASLQGSAAEPEALGRAVAAAIMAQSGA